MHDRPEVVIGRLIHLVAHFVHEDGGGASEAGAGVVGADGSDALALTGAPLGEGALAPLGTGGDALHLAKTARLELLAALPALRRRLAVRACAL